MRRAWGVMLFFFNAPATTAIYTLSLHDALPICATYNPGWKWSVDVSPLSGTDFCEVEHLGMVLEGHATCAFKDGEVYTLGPGDLFYIGPEPHDSWVVGDEKYVSLHFQGADKYAD